jgi:Glycosyl transferase family 2
VVENRQRRAIRAPSPCATLVRRFLAPVGPLHVKPAKPPSFSVIIATYQAAGTIGSALDSALGQTAPACEVIVVDDGSTDPLETVLRPYRSHITYIRQANRGPSAARNFALRRACGDFVAILDADDVYEPTRLEALSELAVVRPDLDILMTDLHIEVDGVILGRFSQSTPFAVSNQNIEILDRCFLAEPAIRRRSLLAIGGFNETLRIGEDWECWIRLLHTGSTAGLVDEPLVRYRLGQANLTSDRPASLRSRVSVLEMASNFDLSFEERRQLKCSLQSCRRRALLAEAEDALRRGTADVRRRSVDVAFAAGMSAGTRVRALAAALAPSVAARRLRVR